MSSYYGHSRYGCWTNWYWFRWHFTLSREFGEVREEFFEYLDRWNIRGDVKRVVCNRELTAWKKSPEIAARIAARSYFEVECDGNTKKILEQFPYVIRVLHTNPQRRKEKLPPAVKREPRKPFRFSKPVEMPPGRKFLERPKKCSHIKGST